MVNIRKFRIIVLVSNQIEYWSNYSIRFEILNIHAALNVLQGVFYHTLKQFSYGCAWPDNTMDKYHWYDLA